MQKPSIFKQVGWMIAKPGKLFEVIKEKPIILLPILIAVVAGLFDGLYSAKAVTNMDLSSLPAQAKSVMQGGFMQTMGSLTVILAPIGSAIALFFNALLFWAMFRIFKGKGSYMQAVSIVGIASFPFMIRNILRYLFAEVPATDLQAQIQLAKTATFGSVFITVLGAIGIVFLVWVVILMTKGFSRVFGVTPAKAAVLICFFYVASLLIQTGTAFAGYQAILNTPNISMGG